MLKTNKILNTHQIVINFIILFKNYKKKNLIKTSYYFILISMCFTNCFCWEGYNWELGEDIEIEEGNLVRPGLNIDVYHWEYGDYHTEEVINVSSGEVETYDYETGEYNTYEMD